MTSIRFGVLIIAHKFSPALGYIVKHLIQGGVKIILHIDSKSKITDFKSILPLVTLIDQRINIKWGKFSQVETMLELLKKGVEMDLDSMQFISGDTLPLNSINEILNFYSDNKTRIEISELPKHQVRRLKYRFNHDRPTSLVSKLYYQIINKFNIYPRNPYFEDLPNLYWGSSWFCLNRVHARYILKYVENTPQFIEAFKYGLCVDEIFFQTILQNSDLNLEIDNVSTMYKYFQGGASPKILGTEDIDFIAKTRLLSEQFAIKISDTIDLNRWYEKFIDRK